MEEERKRVEGYVDKIRASAHRIRRKADHSFSRKVREIMGTSRGRAWEVVEAELRVLSRSVGRYEVNPRGSTQELPEIDVSGISQLLERKIQKAEYGYSIVQDISTLLEGHKKLKNL